MNILRSIAFGVYFGHGGGVSPPTFFLRSLAPSEEGARSRRGAGLALLPLLRALQSALVNSSL